MRALYLTAALLALAAVPATAERVTTPTFDTEAPKIPKDLKPHAILILSKANDWRHDSMPATAKAVPATRRFTSSSTRRGS